MCFPCWLTTATLAVIAASAKLLALLPSRCAYAAPASVKPLSLPAISARCVSPLRPHRFFASFNAANTSEVTSIGAARKSNTTTRGLVTLSQSSKQVAVNLRHVQFNQRANPSIERTCKGWPRYAGSTILASRGQPLPAAHVKR